MSFVLFSRANCNIVPCKFLAPILTLYFPQRTQHPRLEQQHCNSSTSVLTSLSLHSLPMPAQTSFDPSLPYSVARAVFSAFVPYLTVLPPLRHPARNYSEPVRTVRVRAHHTVLYSTVLPTPSPWRCRAQYVLTTAPRDITSAVALFTSGNWVAPRCAVFFPC